MSASPQLSLADVPRALPPAPAPRERERSAAFGTEVHLLPGDEPRPQGGRPLGDGAPARPRHVPDLTPAGPARAPGENTEGVVHDLPDPDARRDARRAREQARVAKLQVLAEAATARRLQANATGATARGLVQ